MRSLPIILFGSAAVVLLVVVVLQVGALRGDVDAVRDEAASAASDASGVRAELTQVLEAVEQLSDELAALPRDGVVPTDSSGLILERMTEIRDDLAALTERVDQICRNAPLELC